MHTCSIVLDSVVITLTRGRLPSDDEKIKRIGNNVLKLVLRTSITVVTLFVS